MKELFREFYFKPSIDFENLDSKTLVVLDTNVLLNIFRYSIESRKLLISSIEKIANNLWVPYLVALEYNLHRQSIVHTMRNQKEKFENEQNQVSNQFLESLNTALDDVGQNIKSTDENDVRQNIKEEIAKIFDPFLKNTIAPILNKEFDLIGEVEDQSDILADILENKIGKSPSQDWIDEIQKEGKIRYELLCPPGYKDDKDKDGKIRKYGNFSYETKYADLLIWNSILEHAKEGKYETLIFVSDDVKEDWIFKVNGKTIGARVELKKEAIEVADVDLIIHNTNSFVYKVGLSKTKEEIAKTSNKDKTNNNDIFIVNEVKPKERWIRKSGEMNSIDYLDHALRMANREKAKMLSLKFETDKVISDEKDATVRSMNKMSFYLSRVEMPFLNRIIADINYLSINVDNIEAIDKYIFLLDKAIHYMRNYMERESYRLDMNEKW
ncbi:hypothetical protein UAY_02073 [Enterococcus moraviensis ATCC BAA-383]|uniref:PIN like domain-containing protein n=1 Tax=Enterococcus moraviensis ATCC BAA-383 TaxID=1158609 RepID=R2SU88_9ENTE|nr:PIN-like domain-containing protein [Enterococcus moraviensis]EOH98805.1 hypothetical protein UAY_02073 [Enterococcus moraviensis ATCC BAA-383]EOT72020.1 hypothetical protein I586_01828 [Enterococcus moraviensis ATCC BAA-383]OJG68140.1 hypothetical protein RV09_GL002251 [Enterococcus moraviensis]